VQYGATVEEVVNLVTVGAVEALSASGPASRTAPRGAG